MSIVEQAFLVSERTSIVKAKYPTSCLFQVFVKGRLQYRDTYSIEGENIDFVFVCLGPGDLVEIFFFIA